MRLGKLLGATLGALVLIVGAALTAAGAVALALPDDDGWIAAPSAHVSSGAAAVVATDIDVDLGDVIENHTVLAFDGIEVRLDVESRNGKDVFVGLARSDAIGTYLAGTDHAEIDLWGDRRLSVDHAGTVPAPPAEQGFWVTASDGGELVWNLSTGEWALVALNADGSPGIDIAVDAAAHVPFIGAVGVGLVVLGLVLVGGGAVTIYLGVRDTPNRPDPGRPIEEEARTPAAIV